MDIKTHLKQICNLEQTIKETEMAITKHKKKKTEVEERINKKRESLENDIAKQQEEIEGLKYWINRKVNFVFAGTKKEKKTTAIICAITIAIQAIITAIIVGCFGARSYVAAAIAYTIIYAVLIAFCLYLEYDMWFKFPIFKTILGIIILTVLYQVTHWYFKTCNNFGINIIGANIITTLIIIGMEIRLGIHACRKAMATQRKEYKENKKSLEEFTVKLEVLEKDLKLQKQKSAAFNTNSAVALAKMNAEINDLEKNCVLNKAKLKALYTQNVLHPNYQNWVAAATIYEYLDVGRCYELKGPDGAYNLYERELLANKIVDSLAAIYSSINYHGNSIYNSQMHIRRQLSECNRKINSLTINTYGF